jgi:hypothetical protein
MKMKISGPTTPISGLTPSHHLGSGLGSYEGGGYVHQTQQNTPEAPSNQNQERNSYLNINNIFNLSLSKSFASKASIQSYEDVGVAGTGGLAECPDNEAALRAHSYGCYSENGVTLTVLRPTPGLTRSRKLLATSYHELSPPYSSNESSPVQKVPDVDVFNFEKGCEQSVPGSPGLYRVSPIARHHNHLVKPPLTPEETTTSGW